MCLVQALVKARGDGLGFDLSKAEFHFDDGLESNIASVWIDGQPQSRLQTHLLVSPLTMTCNQGLLANEGASVQRRATLARAQNLLC